MCLTHHHGNMLFLKCTQAQVAKQTWLQRVCTITPAYYFHPLPPHALITNFTTYCEHWARSTEKWGKVFDIIIIMCNDIAVQSPRGKGEKRKASASHMGIKEKRVCCICCYGKSETRDECARAYQAWALIGREFRLAFSLVCIVTYGVRDSNLFFSLENHMSLIMHVLYFPCMVNIIPS